MSLNEMEKAGGNMLPPPKKKIKISSPVLQAVKSGPYLEGVHSRR